VGTRFSAPVQTGPGAHPASYTMGTGSFPGVKRPGRGVNHLTPSSAEVKESRAIPVLPFWAFVACSRVNFTFTFYCIARTSVFSYVTLCTVKNDPRLSVCTICASQKIVCYLSDNFVISPMRSAYCRIRCSIRLLDQ
jgi:hypothetical protein